MAELYAWGRFTHRSQWARRANYPASNLSDVMNGKAGIEGINLIRLYKAAEEQAASERPVTVVADDEIRGFAVRLLALTRELGRRLGLEEANE